MRIAAVSADAAGVTDGLLYDLAMDLLNDGLTVAGAVQTTTPATDEANKAMDLLLLPDQTPHRISMILPKGTKGCSLDQGALEEAVASVQTRISTDADVVILNKFGQREAEGRGFRDAIAAAVEHDVPLVIGVAPPREKDFEDFIGMSVDQFGPDAQALKSWITSNQS